MGRVIVSIFKGVGFVLNLAFVGLLLISNFIMNGFGILICAITSRN